MGCAGEWKITVQTGAESARIVGKKEPKHIDKTMHPNLHLCPSDLGSDQKCHKQSLSEVCAESPLGMRGAQ